jgi:hypothetical protein
MSLPSSYRSRRGHIHLPRVLPLVGCRSKTPTAAEATRRRRSVAWGLPAPPAAAPEEERGVLGGAARTRGGAERCVACAVVSRGRCGAAELARACGARASAGRRRAALRGWCCGARVRDEAGRRRRRGKSRSQRACGPGRVGLAFWVR